MSNVLCASAALLSAGVDVEHVRKGLRTFDNSPEHNPGRLNVFKLANGTAIVDYAHNEAGISALLDVAEHLATGRVVIVVGTAGDRTDETFIALGRIAAERADSIHLKGTIKYTRGRDPLKMRELMEGVFAIAGPSTALLVETELEAAQHAVEERVRRRRDNGVEDKDEIGRMVRE
ncbi:MAG: cyanophycin synthetase [Chloroflexia bacterium]